MFLFQETTMSASITFFSRQLNTNLRVSEIGHFEVTGKSQLPYQRLDLVALTTADPS